MPCACRRWFLRLSSWAPAEAAEWGRVVSSLQPEEWARADRKLFRGDVLASVAGRLLLRAAAVDAGAGPWSSLHFGREEKEKPFLVDSDLGLNVSHHGDVVALALDCAGPVGVDVMRMERPRSEKSLDAWLAMMGRQFSAAENARIRAQPSDRAKLFWFYRFWCLKEAYIKALGIGIHNRLAELDFGAARGELPCTSTRLAAAPEWAFEEARIPQDEEHLLAVCRKADRGPCAAVPFSEVGIPELLRAAEPLRSVDAAAEWASFQSKGVKMRPS